MSDPTPTKPYLLRAIYEWCVDNGYTPYLSVSVDAATSVPAEHVRNGEIILNVGPLAANRLKMGNEMIEFSARFGGVAREIRVPVARVVAIYARENGQGLVFEPDEERPPAPAGDGTASHSDDTSGEPPEPAGPSGGSASGRPTLRRVK